MPKWVTFTRLARLGGPPLATTPGQRPTPTHCILEHLGSNTACPMVSGGLERWLLSCVSPSHKEPVSNADWGPGASMGDPYM